MKSLHLGEVITPATVKRAGDGDYPILSMTMHDGLVDQSKKFKKQVASKDLSDYRVVKRGQLVVGFPIDEGVLDFQNLYDSAIVSPAYGIWDLQDGLAFDRRYLALYLRSPRAMAYYKAKLRGSTARRRSLPKEVFLALDVPAPPLEEQRRIAAILDRADALRAKRRTVLASVSDLASAVFSKMFGNPVTNDHGWPKRLFGEVCDTRLGKMLDAKQQTGQDVRPYLRNANVQWFHIDLDDILTMDIDERSRAVLRLEPGDVLICEGGQPGRAAIWRGEVGEMYFQKALHRARPDLTQAAPEFIVYLMHSMVVGGGLKDYITSATIGHLTGEKLKSLPIVLPDLRLQKEFALRVGAINVQQDLLEKVASEEDQLFLSIQARAFAGHL